jgi:hypothetical protein
MSGANGKGCMMGRARARPEDKRRLILGGQRQWMKEINTEVARGQVRWKATCDVKKGSNMACLEFSKTLLATEQD